MSFQSNDELWAEMMEREEQEELNRFLEEELDPNNLHLPSPGYLKAWGNLISQATSRRT